MFSEISAVRHIINQFPWTNLSFWESQNTCGRLIISAEAGKKFLSFYSGDSDHSDALAGSRISGKIVMPLQQIQKYLHTQIVSSLPVMWGIIILTILLIQPRRLRSPD